MFESIKGAVSEGVPAIRARTRFQPMGGPGDVLYPPTYGDGNARHSRRLDGQLLPCVLLDSVASQANRAEMALLDTDVARLSAEISEYSVCSLTLPHRFCDAVLRSCDGYPHDVLDARDTKEIFAYAPNSLLWGMWHSNRKGARGIKVPRAMTSELVGIGYADAPHVASRIDPLPISASSKIKIDDSPAGWRVANVGDTPTAKPSEAMLGSVTPNVTEGRGVTIDYALQTTVISLTALRQLRLGDDITTALAAMGVAAASLACQSMWLRSRCELLPESTLEWEKVGTGELCRCEDSETLLAEAFSGLPSNGNTVLTATDDIKRLVAEGMAAIGGGE